MKPWRLRILFRLKLDPKGTGVSPIDGEIPLGKNVGPPLLPPS
jgi:hypothetical protein